MIDDKIKAMIGELVFQNAVLAHQLEDLKKQMNTPKETPNEE